MPYDQATCRGTLSYLEAMESSPEERLTRTNVANQNPRGSAADTGHLNVPTATLGCPTCSGMTRYGRRVSCCSNKTTSNGVERYLPLLEAPKLQRVCVASDDSRSTPMQRLHNTEVLAHVYAR
jgi:hypothetical protein